MLVVKWILVVLVVAIAVIAILAARKPDTFRVSRTQQINAPAEAIFPYLSDFKRWSAWSPFEGLDPHMKREFGGASQGVGAVYGWNGSGKAGEGRMEITEASAPHHLTIALRFIRPFPGENIAEFSLVPTDGGTAVSWTMHGPNPWIARVMQVFCDMDALIGRDFEAGLAKLKAAAESR
ncbi:SRPBCC family protein [Chitinolyticbacter meiyuanensis]|uniref:SRPBCC family protein n=1 Tax=Chitinolyticbacter meiyuanensis TaxID=682798 RepID=UPI001C9E67EF|nr:SRPBCC family protein [Chitinolyticbacter meiyuanensis]